MPGSVTLLGGEPGIGKSTLLLQLLASWKGPTLYVTAEESAHQVRRRAERLGAIRDDLWLHAETSLPHILTAIADTSRELVVIDSIQTVHDPASASLPGSVGQVRGCAHRLVVEAKERNVAIVLVGHVTKDGGLAGPRVLEHVVDTVLQFEGDRHHALRLLRASKHRFGPTNELGLFEMCHDGLAGVPDPSTLFLADRRVGVAGSAVVPTMEGHRPIVVEVQALTAQGVPGVPSRRSAQGLDGGRLSMLMAVLARRGRIPVGEQDVYASTAGGVKLNEPGLDLGCLPRRRQCDHRSPAARPTWRCSARSGSAANSARWRMRPPDHRGGTARLRQGDPADELTRRRRQRAHDARRHARRGDRDRRSERLTDWSVGHRPATTSRSRSLGPPPRIGPCSPVSAPPTSSMRDALARVSPGTPLRDGIDRVVRAKAGALLVLSDGADVLSICSGGFLVDAPYSPQRLSELAKMDGAIIISTDGGRIASANVHLVPDPTVPTSETGTRHRTAERVARSLGVPVVSASEEMGVINVYAGGSKRLLQEVGHLLDRANQALQTLERYKARLDDAIANLTAVEIEDVASLRDVVAVVQRGEMVHRIADEIETMIIELGVDARLLRLQLDELYGEIDDELDLVVADYLPPGRTVADTLVGDVAPVRRRRVEPQARRATRLHLDGDTQDLTREAAPKGLRLLHRVNRLPQDMAAAIADHFGGLSKLQRATVADLMAVDGVDEATARSIRER